MSDISRLPVRGQVEQPDHDILPPGQMRASDKDRSRVARYLIRHNHAGRLEAKPFEARREAAMRARSLMELNALTADLPAQRAKRSRSHWSPMAGIITRVSVMVATLGVMILGSMAVYHAGNHWYQITSGGTTTWYMGVSLWSYAALVGIWLGGIWLLIIQGIFAGRYFDKHF